MEFEPGFLPPFLFLNILLLKLVVMFPAFRNNRLAIYIDRNFRVIEQRCRVAHDLKRVRRRNVEELPVLANSQVREAIYLLMDLPLDLAVL